MSTKIEVFDVTGPAHWASYIINDDASIFGDGGEQDECDAWLDSLPGQLVGCHDGSQFLRYHDAREFSPYTQECVTYIGHILTEENDDE